MQIYPIFSFRGAIHSLIREFDGASSDVVVVYLGGRKISGEFEIDTLTLTQTEETPFIASVPTHLLKSSSADAAMDYIEEECSPLTLGHFSSPAVVDSLYQDLKLPPDEASGWIVAASKRLADEFESAEAFGELPDDIQRFAMDAFMHSRMDDEDDVIEWLVDREIAQNAGGGYDHNKRLLLEESCTAIHGHRDYEDILCDELEGWPDVTRLLRARNAAVINAIMDAVGGESGLREEIAR